MGQQCWKRREKATCVEPSMTPSFCHSKMPNSLQIALLIGFIYLFLYQTIHYKPTLGVLENIVLGLKFK